MTKQQQIENLIKEIDRKDRLLQDSQRENTRLKNEFEGLHNSFRMVKDNLEREKTRLDQALQSLLNITKGK